MSIGESPGARPSTPSTLWCARWPSETLAFVAGAALAGAVAGQSPTPSSRGRRPAADSVQSCCSARLRRCDRGKENTHLSSMKQARRRGKC